MLSAVPSFATRRFPDPRIGLLPGVLLELLCWHALSGVIGAERLRHVLKVFATFYSLLSFLRNEDSSGGEEATWLFWPCHTGLLEYTRPPKHMTGKDN